MLGTCKQSGCCKQGKPQTSKEDTPQQLSSPAKGESSRAGTANGLMRTGPILEVSSSASLLATYVTYSSCPQPTGQKECTTSTTAAKYCARALYLAAVDSGFMKMPQITPLPSLCTQSHQPLQEHSTIKSGATLIWYTCPSIYGCSEQRRNSFLH